LGEQSLLENLPQKCIGAGLAQGSVEGENYSDSHTQLFEFAKVHIQRSDRERAALWVKQSGGMSVEGDEDAGKLERLGLADGFSYDGLVAEVNAVKGSDARDARRPLSLKRVQAEMDLHVLSLPTFHGFATQMRKGE
jgi:hypothetical protein